MSLQLTTDGRLRHLLTIDGLCLPVCAALAMVLAARGLGAGRRLCEELITFARHAGYTLMKLDTEPELEAACALYRALGFVEIPRYNDDPKMETLYLGLRL